MGMYNEVFSVCPKCRGCGYMQVAQITLGFGGFNLDNPDTMAELDDDDLETLRECIKAGKFECERCQHVFNSLTGYGMPGHEERNRERVQRILGYPKD